MRLVSAPFGRAAVRRREDARADRAVPLASSFPGPQLAQSERRAPIAIRSASMWYAQSSQLPRRELSQGYC